MTVLADWAAIAIANARLYRDVRSAATSCSARTAAWRRRRRSPARWAASTDLDRVLELVVKRSRALIDARAAELALLDGDELVVAAVAGDGVDGRARRAPAQGGLGRRRWRCRRAARSASTDVPEDTVAGRTLGARTRARHADGVPQPADRRAERVRPQPRRRDVLRRGRAAARRPSRRARRPRWRRRRARPARRCGAACRPPSRSAGAGRGSCTTRRCRSSPA